MKLQEERSSKKSRFPLQVRQSIPVSFRQALNDLYYDWVDTRDFLAEIVSLVPSHNMRIFVYRYILGIKLGTLTTVHRGCRFYFPSGVAIGNNCVINRDVLLDGRSGLTIHDNVSVSEGSAIFTLDHDPNSPTFENRGSPVVINNQVYIGSRAVILPGVTVGEGAVIGAGAVVPHDVEPYHIVAGVPARTIGHRNRNLTYKLNYRKFLG